MFVKNDSEFICKNCGEKVSKLNYTSRDHCNFCLHSLHVDIDPGDRRNECKGILIPINIEETSKKGKVVIYKCSRCGKIVKNIVAVDDDQNIIYEIIEKFAKNGGNI